MADAELILMGEGTPEYEKYLKGLAAECKYGHITFHGFVMVRPNSRNWPI